jgi:hypothetical protein
MKRRRKQNWNKYYGHNYKYNDVLSSADKLKLLTIFVVGVVLFILLLVYSATLDRKQTEEIKAALPIILLMIPGCFILTREFFRFIKRIYNALIDRITGFYRELDTQEAALADSYVHKPSKVKGYIHNYTDFLLPDERRKPPKALFFGRLNGITYDRAGLYEEGWLNRHEMDYWKGQNERKQALEDGILDENPKLAAKVAESVTKLYR